jgi:hypothetical protein
MEKIILKIKELINGDEQKNITVLNLLAAISFFLFSITTLIVSLENLKTLETNNNIENKEEILTEEKEEDNEEIDEEQEEYEQVMSWEEFQIKYNVEDIEPFVLEEIYQNQFVSPLSVKTFEIENFRFNTLRIPEVTFSDDVIIEMKNNNLYKYNEATKYIDEIIAKGEENAGMPFNIINYYTYTKGSLFSIIIEENSGWSGSSFKTNYAVYNFDGEFKKSISSDELLANFNISREQFNNELVKKVRNSLLTQIYFYWLHSDSNKFDESDVMSTYNEMLLQKDSWEIFIDQDQDLSVVVPVLAPFDSQEFLNPFIIKVIGNI